MKKYCVRGFSVGVMRLFTFTKNRLDRKETDTMKVKRFMSLLFGVCAAALLLAP